MSSLKFVEREVTVTKKVDVTVNLELTVEEAILVWAATGKCFGSYSDKPHRTLSTLLKLSGDSSDYHVTQRDMSCKINELAAQVRKNLIT